MKNLLLLITLSLISLNSFAYCNAKITNKVAADYMGHLEIQDALHDQSYYRPYRGEEADIEISFKLNTPYICSQSRHTIIDEIKTPLNSMVMTVLNKKTGEKSVYKKNMRFYYLKKNIEKRTIKKLIKQLPQCEK